MRRAGAAALLLALLGLAWWGHAIYQKRALHGAVVALAIDATSRVHDALQLRGPGSEDFDRLEDQFKAIGAATQRLAALETWRNPPLGEAAQQYLDEGRALVRRLIAVQRAGAAVRADLGELADHLRAARGRSSHWISEAVALQQRLDRNFFDYRLAEGGLRKSLLALPVARDALVPLATPAPLAEDRLLADARSWLEQASAQLAREVEAARKLPLAR